MTRDEMLDELAGYEIEISEPSSPQSRQELIDSIARYEQEIQQLKTDEQALRAQYQRDVDRYNKGPESGLEDFGEGLAASGLGTYYGLKDLIPGLEVTEEQRARLKDWELDAAESGYGSAGRILGEIAQIAIPGTGIAKGLSGAAKLLPKAAQVSKPVAKVLTRANPIAADIAASGLHAGAQLPGEGQSRSVAATKGALDAASGNMVAAPLAKAVRGIRKTREGRELLEAGVPVTPGGVSKGQVADIAEGIGDIFPGTAGPVKELQTEALEGANKYVIDRVGPPGAGSVGKIGQDAIEDLRLQYKDAYSEAWKKVDGIDPNAIQDMLAQIRKLAPKVSIDDQRFLESIARDVSKLGGKKGRSLLQRARKLDPRDILPATGGAQKLYPKDSFKVSESVGSNAKALDNVLRKAIQGTQGKGTTYDLSKHLDDLRNTLRGGISKDADEALDAIDVQYPKYLSANRASELASRSPKTSKTDGVFTPDQFNSAVAKVGGERIARGKAPAQELAKVLNKGIQLPRENAFFTPIRQITQKLKVPTVQPILKGAGRVGLGETGTQKFLQRGLQSPQAQALREWVRAGAVGGAVGENPRAEEDY